MVQWGKILSQPLDQPMAVIGHFAGKCDLGELQDNLDKVEKWLKFGKDYAALKDSSELDFDKMDVAAVPEVMQVNTEMLHLQYLMFVFQQLVILLFVCLSTDLIVKFYLFCLSLYPLVCFVFCVSLTLCLCVSLCASFFDPNSIAASQVISSS